MSRQISATFTFDLNWCSCSILLFQCALNHELIPILYILCLHCPLLRAQISSFERYSLIASVALLVDICMGVMFETVKLQICRFESLDTFFIRGEPRLSSQWPSPFFPPDTVVIASRAFDTKPFSTADP